MRPLPISADARTQNGAAASLIVLLWIAFFFFASAGVRGSDQFWYVSEVRAIMEGDPRSNSLWPHFVFSDDNYLQSRPFVHQGILPYFVGLWKGILDPYKAWILSNLLFVLSSAVLIYSSLYKLRVNKSVAIWAALLFLSLPLTFWLATQPMNESAVGFFCALLIRMSVSDISKYYRFTLIAFIALLGQFIVSIFIPVVIIALMCFCWMEWKAYNKKSIYSILYYSLISILVLILSANFGSTLNFDIVQIMMNGTGGSSNMNIWITEGEIPFSFLDYMSKIKDNVNVFFKIDKNQIFIFPMLFLMVSNFIYFSKKIEFKSVLRKSIKFDENVIVLSIFLNSTFIYFAIIIFHQNQFRYFNYISPAIIFVSFYIYRNYLVTIICKFKYLIIAAFCMLLGLCFVLSLNLRAESLEVAKNVSQIRQDAEKNGLLNSQAPVIECYRGGQSLLLAYALPEVVFVHADRQNSLQQLNRLKAKTGARLYLCDAGPSRRMRDATANAAVKVSEGLPSLGEQTVISLLR